MTEENNRKAFVKAQDLVERKMMNLNVDKAIPRKLSIALATMYILKDIEAPSIIVVCITVIASLAIVMQWNLDRRK